MTSKVHPERLGNAAAVRGVTITEVAQTLGVPMPTLRSWELRYGVPASSRRSGQHRRYTPEELHELRLMRDEVARGTRARAAADIVHGLLAASGPEAELIGKFLAGVAQLDPSQVQAALDEALSALGVGAAIDDVMLPALRRSGTWWAIGACDAEPEILAVRVIRRWLGRQGSLTPPPVAPGAVLLGGGPLDVHSVGVEALALLLQTQRLHTRLLGGRTPTEQLRNAASELEPVAVVVVSNLATGRRSALASIETMERAGYPTFYAGSAFASPTVRRRMPGTFLGTRISDAAEIISAAVTVRAASMGKAPR